MKGKNLQPRILYPARFSFRFDGEIKSFPDKQKLREFTTTKPALKEMLKELLQTRGQDKEETYRKQTPNNWENGNRIIHSGQFSSVVQCVQLFATP